ncbi:MAG: 30S ribosome-binding factor RbfA [Pseudomonadota bacterium]
MRVSFQRTDRISDVIKKEISEVLLREVKDPRLVFVTITDVQVTKDLKNAKVFFTTLREGEELAAISEGLRHAAGFVQRKLGARLHLRCTPHIFFAYDSSIEEGARMDKILRGIKETLEPTKEE